MLNSSRLPWLALLIFAAVVWTLWPQSSPEKASETGAQLKLELEKFQQRISALEADLSREIITRQALERRLAQLEHNGSLATAASSTPEAASYKAPPMEIMEPGFAATIDDNMSGSDAPELVNIEQKLLAIGLPPDTAQAVRHRIDQNRLEMLSLRDTAFREGWSESDRYTEQMRELSDSTRGIREEFGDQVYDQYLFAAGRPNRVVVREVYRGSAAETAGIRPGDIITGYAAERIFSMSNLREATLQGEAGETVLVDLIRDQQPISTNIMRGPMGISMGTTSLAP